MEQQPAPPIRLPCEFCLYFWLQPAPSLAVAGIWAVLDGRFSLLFKMKETEFYNPRTLEG